MEELQTEEMSADSPEGPREEEPQTIGEALKKYYEEQLKHRTDPEMVTLSGRKAELELIFRNHIASLN
jgi:hypothetical protein